MRFYYYHHRGLFIVCSVLFLLPSQLFCSRSFPLRTPESCNDSQYFHPSGLICLRCRENERRTSDGLNCQCQPRYHWLSSLNESKIQCVPCPSDQAVSADGWSCVTCSSANPFDNSTSACAACVNGVSEERWENETIKHSCIPCPATHGPDSTGTRCIRCPKDFLLSSNGSCICANQFTLTGGACIPTKHLLPPESSLFTIIYQNGRKVKSFLFEEHLQAATYNCKVLDNGTACQILGNLCVLLLYRTNDSPLEPTACSEFLTANSSHQGRSHVPWIFYTDLQPAQELSRTDVPNLFSTNVNSAHSYLNLTVIGFSTSGKYQGVHHLSTVLTQICKASTAEMEHAFSFGVNFHRKCTIGSQELWDNTKLEFYDIYLSSVQDNGDVILYPVPILIRNIISNGQRINTGTDPSQWKFVRRFFIVEQVTSGLQYDVLRYLTSISVRVNVMDDGGGDGAFGRIYPPLLVLEYAELTSEDRKKNPHIQIDLSVSYTMEQGETFRRISIALGVLSSLSVLWTCFSTWGWSKRTGKDTIDFLVICKFMVFLCGNLANVFLLVLLMASLNWLVIFKSQDAVHLLLPTPQQESTLLVCLVAAFVMKTVHVIHVLVEQCSLNVFFIDWEQTAATNERRNPVQEISAEGHTVSGVSVWRVYFIANEWNELQSRRRVLPHFHLFLLLFFLKVVGLEKLGVSHSDSGLSIDQRYTPTSATAQFAITATTFLCLALIQVTLHRVFYERFFRDTLQQFVDLCSVCNISLFLLTGARYGYYIHGRSAHGRADVGMKEMHDLLRKEEEDLCSQRGLLPNTEQQTFTMFLLSGVQQQYASLLLPLTSYSQSMGRMQGVGSRLSKVDINRVTNTYQMVNKFLSGFIEHAYKDLDYVVRDRLFLEKLLDLEFSLVYDKGYFYNDNGHSFDSVLFYGQEAMLLTFEVLLFSVVVVAAGDVVLAAVLTYSISKVVEWIRKSAGRRNLVRKALIDERFLN